MAISFTHPQALFYTLKNIVGNFVAQGRLRKHWLRSWKNFSGNYATRVTKMVGRPAFFIK